MKFEQYITEDVGKIKQLVKKARDLGGLEDNPFQASQQKAVLIWHEVTKLVGNSDDRLDSSNKEHSNYAYEIAYSMIEGDWTDAKKVAKKLKFPIKKEYLKI